MMELKLTGADMGEIARQAREIARTWEAACSFHAGESASPAATEAATEVAPAETRAETPVRAAPHRPTVEELIAGMTLKPTQTTTISGNVSVKNGDHVSFKGEDWIVYQTYRGRVVAANEANVADIIPAEECFPPSARTQAAEESAPAAPRPGTAAALLGDQHPAAQSAAPAGPLSAEDVARITNWLTDLVGQGKITVEAVFSKLGDYGAAKVADLDATKAAAFEAAVKQMLAPQQFGF